MVKSVEGAPEVSKWKAPAFIFSEGNLGGNLGEGAEGVGMGKR